MGNLIFGTTTVQGRTFDDIKIQTSKEGVPRAIVFGRARPIVGNIIATTAPRIVVVREEQDGGKGGPSTVVENEEVYRTYAIRICEGPVTGVRRVWRNNELVYVADPVGYIDSQHPMIGPWLRDHYISQLEENNTAFLEKAEFFLGGFDQMPSAVMQAAFGMDQVHGYRGTCYMVVDDENLTGTGGAIPQYAFEVERAEGKPLTSRPYPLYESDGVVFSPGLKRVGKFEANVDSAQFSAELVDIVLDSLVEQYDSGFDALEFFGAEITGIQLDSILKETDVGFDELQFSGAEITDIELSEVLIPYEMEVEGLQFSGAEITDITLDQV